jgi:hypothetical protein
VHLKLLHSLLAPVHLSSMSRRKAQKQNQEITLVPHRTPNLSALLERAKSGDAARAVEAYLNAGGAADTLVRHQHGLITLQLPLLHIMAFTSAHPHKELAESVRLLVLISTIKGQALATSGHH